MNFDRIVCFVLCTLLACATLWGAANYYLCLPYHYLGRVFMHDATERIRVVEDMQTVTIQVLEDGEPKLVNTFTLHPGNTYILTGDVKKGKSNER